MVIRSMSWQICVCVATGYGNTFPKFRVAERVHEREIIDLHQSRSMKWTTESVTAATQAGTLVSDGTIDTC